MRQADLAADGTLRQIEFASGCREGAEARHRFEGGERRGVRQNATLHVHDPLLTLIDP